MFVSCSRERRAGKHVPSENGHVECERVDQILCAFCNALRFHRIAQVRITGAARIVRCLMRMLKPKTRGYLSIASRFVPGAGLEPARPKAQPPEDCASTNFATRVELR